MSQTHAHMAEKIGVVGRFQQSVVIADLMRKAQYVDESAIQVVVEMDHHVVTLHDIFDPRSSVHLHGVEADNFITSSRKLADMAGLSHKVAQKVAAYDYQSLKPGSGQ